MESKRHLESNYIQFGVRRQDNVLLKHHSLFSIYATLKKRERESKLYIPFNNNKNKRSYSWLFSYFTLYYMIITTTHGLHILLCSTHFDRLLIEQKTRWISSSFLLSEAVHQNSNSIFTMIPVREKLILSWYKNKKSEASTQIDMSPVEFSKSKLVATRIQKFVKFLEAGMISRKRWISHRSFYLSYLL